MEDPFTENIFCGGSRRHKALLNLAKYDLTILFCFLGKPIVYYYILEFKVRQLRTNDVNGKKARKKETLSIDRSKL